MPNLTAALRDRVEDAYARFLEAYEEAAQAQIPNEAGDLLRERTDELMRALAQVMIQLSTDDGDAPRH